MSSIYRQLLFCSSNLQRIKNHQYLTLSLRFHAQLKRQLLVPTSRRRYISSTNSNHNNNINKHDDDSSIVSNRAAFRAIPINQPILTHIKTIGVGIRQTHRKKMRAKLNTKTSSGGDRKRNQNYQGQILSERNEKEFLNHSSNRGGKTAKRNDEKIFQGSEVLNSINKSDWLPPPPFSTSGITNEWIDEIKRLPVKILGSVGSKDEKMPTSSKLPEVAIIGRSNVGKSTLLNALLYGNQSNNENRIFVRGKTPKGAKMEKGLKAVVSSKPGETKKITFYQLTAAVRECTKIMGSPDEIEKYKMSLVLVDLPGYGFAFAKEEKAQLWLELMNEFLITREKSLKRILFLIDARHGFKKADFDFLENLQMLGQKIARQEKDNAAQKHERKSKFTLPPIQIVLTKCDLVTQQDLARRVVSKVTKMYNPFDGTSLSSLSLTSSFIIQVQVRQQFSDALIREPSSLPVMLCSAKAGLGFNNIRGKAARGGILEIQRELAAIVPNNK